MDTKLKVIKILARIIDIHLVKPLSLTIGNNTDKEINDDNSKLIE